MNIYIESNFILELSLSQNQSEGCTRLLTLGETKRIDLFLPVYCFAECWDNQKTTLSRRNTFKTQVMNMREKFIQSNRYSHDIDIFTNLLSLIDKSNEVENESLNSILLLCSKKCNLIPITPEIIEYSGKLVSDYKIKKGDAVIFSSIIWHLNNNHEKKSCFLCKNSKEFQDPDLIDKFQQLNCKLIFNFDHGYQFVINNLDI